MEYAVNELDQPVIYIINYEYSDQYMSEKFFVAAAATIEDAQKILAKDKNNKFLVIHEHVLSTGVTTPLLFLQQQLVEKFLLDNLYKTGEKKKIFEGLDARKNLQSQVTFPLAPELAKARVKASTFTSI